MNLSREIESTAPDEHGADYRRVERAIRYIEANREAQPDLGTIAAHVGLSPHHFQRLFRRWAGITPKQLLGCLTLEHAKALLRDHESVLEAALESGLSGPGRLHALFARVEALTPGEYRARGADLLIRHGVHPSPFGPAQVLATDRGICGLRFLDDAGTVDSLADARRRWPLSRVVDAPGETAVLAAAAFGGPTRQRALELVLRGTPFQVQVWRALLSLPPGRACTYGDLARAVGRPRAARAVGQAVGANPVAVLIPCHRVLRGSGALGGYRWGTERKCALLAWEMGRGSTAG